jgi:YVTN family beta-propeller protein
MLLAQSPPDAVAGNAYVLGGEVSVIDTVTNQVAPKKIRAGSAPSAIAITPDGRTAYVANREDDRKGRRAGPRARSPGPR